MIRSFRSRSQLIEGQICTNYLSSVSLRPYSTNIRVRRSPLTRWVPPRGLNANDRKAAVERIFESSRSNSDTAQVTQAPLVGPLNHGFPTGNILRGGHKSDIRERLRKWENENVIEDSQYLENDPPLPESLVNALTRPQDTEFVVEPEFDTLTDGPPPGVEFGQLGDSSNSSEYLSQGDLVELSSTGRQQQELAIYVRDLETQSQFYTMSGKYLHRNTKAAQFCVPGFVAPHKLEEICKYLPTTDVPEDMRDRLHSFPLDVPRNIGKPLIQKMLDFWARSDSIYRIAAPKLDNAQEALSHPRHFTYHTLDSLAKKLLAGSVPTASGQYSNEALYAVHRSILNNKFGFRAQKRGNLRTRGIYELSPTSEAKTIHDVVDQVRKYQEEEVLKRRGVEGDIALHLERFAIKARRLIDQSRELREFTTHGIIGTTSTKSRSSKKAKVEKEGGRFDSNDRNYVSFLKSWAALSTFDPTSFLHGTGSTILRAIGRYDGISLDQTTAWTCLQEIGAIAPWENQATYTLRLQDRRAKNIEIQEDAMKHLRKDWGDLPVYCIDDVGAQEIDDGISIEAIDQSEEFWVHIHVADPAAHMPPAALLPKHGVYLPQSIYMPEQVIPMLPGDVVKSHLSLAPNRPTLTFSARIDLEGNILETSVAPGIIHNVKSITPSTVDEVINGASSSQTLSPVFSVGSTGVPESPTRPLLAVEDLDDKDIDNLQSLHNIAQARREKRKRNGCIDDWPGNYTVAVSFNPPWERHAADRSYRYLRDPEIQIATSPYTRSQSRSKARNTVEDMMIVAGEVAAQFCLDRGLPAPYRLTIRKPDRPEPKDFYQRFVLPELDANGKIPDSVKKEYMKLLQTTISTSPGNHVGMGVDKFLKCTSPLRRLTDIIVHWQIEAAILEESKLGQSLIGNTGETFLPFSKSMLNGLIPSLDTRERMATVGMSDGQRAWLCNFLVRAWKFQEGQLPATFSFLARSVRSDGIVSGTITDIPAYASMPAPPWIDPEGINEGDLFKVKLADVCVYKRKITVNAVERLSKP
ncbi:hypothetical protein F5884DRAFT_169521 [Xylogone sp. PMI_703]|nr:hypothetical protein F5884DRAFT_169521 [Xylogone sp. PMI_703]